MWFWGGPTSYKCLKSGSLFYTSLLFSSPSILDCISFTWLLQVDSTVDIIVFLISGCLYGCTREWINLLLIPVYSCNRFRNKQGKFSVISNSVGQQGRYQGEEEGFCHYLSNCLQRLSVFSQIRDLFEGILKAVIFSQAFTCVQSGLDLPTIHRRTCTHAHAWMYTQATMNTK